MPKPTRAAVIHPPDRAFVPVGKEFKPEADGDSGDGGGGRQSSLLIRVFYRVNGIPMAHVLYNGRATDNVGGAASRRFTNDPAQTTAFKPDAKQTFSLRVVAWDHANRPGHGADHRSRVTHFSAI